MKLRKGLTPITCDHCGKELERWKACECGETMTKSIRDQLADLIDGSDFAAYPEAINDRVDEMMELFRSWALKMVKEVRDVNESNGRYNACAEMERKIEEATK